MHLYPPTTPPAGGVAPTVLVGSPYPSPGETRADQDVGDRIGLATLRGAGYNVLTWDARGIGASAGSIMFDSPAVEGRDVRAIIDFVAAQPEAQLDAPGDPRVGMSGTSYGATIQYIAAALDARVDAIVPDIGWESLTTSLRRGGAVKTGWLAGLCGLDTVPGAVDGKAEPADVKPASAGDELKTACLEGVRGRLSKASRKWLADHGPGALLGSIRAPALIMQGTTDTLFPLDQASAAYAALRRNGVPVQMLWYCGGHVACTADPGDPRTLARAGLAWLNRWLRRDATVDTGAPFQWLADDGVWRSGPDFPLASAGALEAVGSGSLTIAPKDSPLRGLGRASAPARNAVDVRFPPPSAEADLVGNPRVRLVYRGRAKPQRTFLYTQIVDDESDRVLGGLATPLPVILDGRRARGRAPAGGDRRARRPGLAVPAADHAGRGDVRTAALEGQGQHLRRVRLDAARRRDALRLRGGAAHPDAPACHRDLTPLAARRARRARQPARAPAGAPLRRQHHVRRAHVPASVRRSTTS